MLIAPLVSVVIPTLRRPKLLMRALRSVFGQTVKQIEVIVVVDGPDEETVASLQSLTDPRLTVIVNPQSLNAAASRNIGVASANGEWIAFLDDDDEWLPQKLEAQLAFAKNKDAILVSCLSRVITPSGTYIWPATIFDNTCPIDDYLFDRRTAFAGSGFIQTSSYLMARSLFQRSPFKLDTPHDDWDFLLRLSKQVGARVEIVPEVLVNLFFEEPRPSLGRSGAWTDSLTWLDNMRPLFTRRAYSGFCLGVVGSRAANEHAYGAFFPLLFRAYKNGHPRLRHIIPFLAFWILWQSVRRKMRAWFRGERGVAIRSEA
jgi:glycosyltransferase involved in cell wall biosynthesis